MALTTLERYVAAAEILRKVANSGECGMFPDDVTCEQLGRALLTIMVKAREGDALVALIKGYRSAEAEWIENTIRKARA